MIDGRAELVSAGLKNLPPFPPVASKLMTLLTRDNISFREVANIMKTDPALSMAVLRLANSALAGARYPVKSIMESLAIVGIQRVSALLMTLSLSKLLQRCGSSATLRQAWRHSLACALAARELAGSCVCDAEDAYLAGLFHDVGRLVLFVTAPQVYERLVKEDGDLRALELAHFGVDHCTAAALVMDRWKLPQAFRQAALHHHDPGLNTDPLTRVVGSACALANQIGFSVRRSPTLPDTSGPLGFSIAEAINALECEYSI